MAYFFVLPIFLLWLVISSAVLFALRVKASAWPGRTYVFHASLWASLGVLGANALLVTGLAFGTGFITTGAEAEGGVQAIFRVVWGIMVIIGPLFASAIGWLLGLLVGLIVAFGRSCNADA